MTLYAGFIMAIDAQVSDAAHWPLVLLCYVVDPNAMSWKLEKLYSCFFYFAISWSNRGPTINYERQ